MNSQNENSTARTWARLKLVASGRVVLTIGAFVFGLATAILVFGRPSFVQNVNAASWASAFASFSAAIVALGLGLYAAKKDAKRDRDKSHGAALVFLSNVTEVLALVELIQDKTDIIAASNRAAEHLKGQLLEMQPLLPAETLSYLPYLPQNTAKLVVLSNQRLASTKQRISVQHSHEELTNLLNHAQGFLTGCFLPLGNQLFNQIFGPGHAPPWRASNPAQGIGPNKSSKPTREKPRAA